MKDFKNTFLGLTLLSLNGCLSVTSVGEHTFAQDYTGDARRILVLTEMDTRPGAADVGVALKTGLQHCGIQAHVAEISEFALDAPAKLNATIDTLKPEVILTLHMTSGWIQYKTPVLQRYEITVTSVVTRQEVWKGAVSWWANQLSDRSEVASNLASKIIKQMAQERILKVCSEQSENT